MYTIFCSFVRPYIYHSENWSWHLKGSYMKDTDTHHFIQKFKLKKNKLKWQFLMDVTENDLKSLLKTHGQINWTIITIIDRNDKYKTWHASVWCKKIWETSSIWSIFCHVRMQLMYAICLLSQSNPVNSRLLIIVLEFSSQQGKRTSADCPRKQCCSCSFVYNSRKLTLVIDFRWESASFVTTFTYKWERFGRMHNVLYHNNTVRRTFFS